LGRPLKYEGMRYPETDTTNRPDGPRTSMFR